MYCYLVKIVILQAVLLGVISCASVYRASEVSLDEGSKVFVLPLANNTETPLAGYRAGSIAGGVLKLKGFNVASPAISEKKDEIEEVAFRKLTDQAKSWGAKYILTGSVNEWRYKTGIDGEPAVSISLELKELATGNIVWSGVGSKSGWGVDSVGTVAQKLISGLLDNISVTREQP